MSRTEALEGLLKATPPAGLSALAAEELKDLADAIAGARRAQAAELQAAGEKAYAQIPWLLRGPIRKVMGG